MGDMTQGALKLMESYIEPFAGDQTVYGQFRIITTAAPRKLGHYDEYRVKVRMRNQERQVRWHFLFKIT